MSKVFTVSVELDGPLDVESAQARYLDGVLTEARPAPAGSGFAVRFPYDLDGTSHWDGALFVLEVSDGRCFLRRAGRYDTSGTVSRIEQAEIRREARALYAGRLKPKAGAPTDVIVALDAPWDGLDGRTLREAFELFRVAEVMGS